MTWTGVQQILGYGKVLRKFNCMKSENEWKIWFYPTEINGSLICGSGAGVLSKIIIYPLDVVKKRLQVQGFDKARAEFGGVRHYQGMSHCLYTIAMEEGILHGFYKGLAPSLWKAALVSGSSFYVYEKVCQLLEFRHKKNHS